MSDNRVNVLMVGTGEYTTGYVGGAAADSDKGAGVVALTMFDLRRRSKVGRVGMCGVNVSGLGRILWEQRENLFTLTFGAFIHRISPKQAGQEVSGNSHTHAEEHWRCIRRYGFDLRHLSCRR